MVTIVVYINYGDNIYRKLSIIKDGHMSLIDFYIVTENSILYSNELMGWKSYTMPAIGNLKENTLSKNLGTYKNEQIFQQVKAIQKENARSNWINFIKKGNCFIIYLSVDNTEVYKRTLIDSFSTRACKNIFLAECGPLGAGIDLQPDNIVAVKTVTIVDDIYELSYSFAGFCLLKKVFSRDFSGNWDQFIEACNTIKKEPLSVVLKDNGGHIDITDALSQNWEDRTQDRLVVVSLNSEVMIPQPISEMNYTRVYFDAIKDLLMATAKDIGKRFRK